MAQLPPELIERFVQERDQRRKLIAACSGIDHPFPQKLSELASHRLDWIEGCCKERDAHDLPDWLIAKADIDLRIEAVNCHIGMLRALEAAAGKDHTYSTKCLRTSFFVNFPEWNRTWRKTQLKAYWTDRERFEAVFDVWARENGVAENGFRYAEQAPQAVLEKEERSNRLTKGEIVSNRQRPTESAKEIFLKMWEVDQEFRARWEGDHVPACLEPDIYKYVGKQTGKDKSTLRRSIDRFCQTAPHFVVCDLERGRLQRDPIISKWVSFMHLQKR